MTLNKCIVLPIGTLTGHPLCRESHPLCRLKSPTVISIWLLVGFHPATRNVQSTPADNTWKRVWQYIEKERKTTIRMCIFTVWPEFSQTTKQNVEYFLCLSAALPIKILRTCKLIWVCWVHSLLVLSVSYIISSYKGTLILFILMQPPFKFRNSKWCWVSNLTV